MPNNFNESFYIYDGAKEAVEEFVDSNNNLEVTLNTPLNKDLDSIDVAKMSSGGTIVALNSITSTSTSSEIDCRGYKNLRIESEVTAWTAGNVTPSITGSEISGGTFGSIYRDVAGTMTAYAMPAQAATGKNIYIIYGVPNFIKLTQTIATTATSTVRVTPFN